MKEIKVKSIMVPLSKYSTISKDATLYEAVLGLGRGTKEVRPR